jgi:hypothetical protein
VCHRTLRSQPELAGRFSKHEARDFRNIKNVPKRLLLHRPKPTGSLQKRRIIDISIPTIGAAPSWSATRFTAASLPPSDAAAGAAALRRHAFVNVD